MVKKGAKKSAVKKNVAKKSILNSTAKSNVKSPAKNFINDFLKTGVPGLDEILKGGYQKGSTIAVTGGPGAGKSIFALQFIYEGCKAGEPGLFIVTDQTIEDTKKEARRIGMDFDSFEKKGLVTFMEEEPKKPLLISEPLRAIKDKNIKRVVLDNITFFEFPAASEIEFRKSFLHFLTVMKQTKVTLLVITQANIHNDIKIEYKPQDFLFDGLIMLVKIRKGATFERCMAVLKMRNQEHLMNIYPFRIEEGGIRVYTKQIPFSLK